MLQRMIEAKAIVQENNELKAILDLRQHSRDTIAVARIVGSSFSSPRRYAILSAGRSDGVRPGMPVRSADGLVGRIIDSGALSSRLLLISDRASIVPARLLRDGRPVIAQGRGDGTIDVRPLEVGRNPFRPNDIIITSGTGGLYPPLVPVAKVVKLNGDSAIAVPLADPANTSFAMVEAPYEPAAVAAESAPAASEAP
jgi:rod shape-determining protein MreC